MQKSYKKYYKYITVCGIYRSSANSYLTAKTTLLVWDEIVESSFVDKVYIATDSEQIKEAVAQFKHEKICFNIF